MAMSAQAEPYTFQEALDKFMHNFYHECTFSLNHETIAIYEQEYKAYHQKLPELVRTITELEESELMLPQKDLVEESIGAINAGNQAVEPRPAQKNALEALEKTLEEQYGELDDRETEAFLWYEAWLKDAESTVMTKSYKMVLLLYMLVRDNVIWTSPFTPEAAALFFHTYLTEKEYRKRIDFSDAETRGLWEFNESKVSRLIARMPMAKWSGSSKELVIFDNNQFALNIQLLPEELVLLKLWSYEICLYRLNLHFERRDVLSPKNN